MKHIILTLAVVCPFLLACTRQSQPLQIPTVVQYRPADMSAPAPKALVYRVNGDYAQYVPVVLNSERTAVVSYPAPSDIARMGDPIALDGGWWLDRTGFIGPNTAFLPYTYSQYAALKQAPTPTQILEQVLPGARVTQVQRLDVTLAQAVDMAHKGTLQVPVRSNTYIAP